MTKTCYCYRIDGPSGSYIGKANDPDLRWKQHRQTAKKGGGWVLGAAIRKHGPDLFVLRVLEALPGEEAALAREHELIVAARAAGQALYNISEGGHGTVGTRKSDSWRAATSARMQGNKNGLGAKRSPSWIARNRALHTGRLRSAAHRARISAAQTGRKWSAASIERREKAKRAKRARELAPALVRDLLVHSAERFYK